jgi:hypothetical protein
MRFTEVIMTAQLITTAIPSSDLGADSVDELGIFRIFLWVIPFTDFYSINTIYVPIPFDLITFLNPSFQFHNLQVRKSTPFDDHTC